MAIKKVCNSGDFWGAKYISCDYELEPEDGEIYKFMVKEIEGGMDYIPDELEYKTYRCLNADCSEWEDLIFLINPFNYLSNEEVKALEEVINKLYEEGE